jgi:isocitrate dehydrogenase (NAD+)
MPHSVTLIHGGGIGHDMIPAVRRILDAAGVDIAWDEFLAGGEAEAAGKPALPAELFDSVRRTGLALKTKLMPSPKNPRRNYNIEIRKSLGLFASVRPLRNLRGLPARFQGVNMLIVRELTEDLYASIEHEVVPGVVQSIKVVTETASRRFFHFAFALAQRLGRKTVHCVHKANILKLADGLVLEAFRSVAKGYPQLTTKEIIVDNCCMQMVSRPQQFDVLVMGNLYGDIVSDVAAGVTGGISTTHGINHGDGVRVFESFHGAAREDVGVNQANPLPLLLPALDLLEALGETDAAGRILKSIEAVLSEGRYRSHDLGGQATTSEVADAILRSL